MIEKMTVEQLFAAMTEEEKREFNRISHDVSMAEIIFRRYELEMKEFTLTVVARLRSSH